MSIVWFLVIMNIAVFVHELAHYAAARAQGVAVKAFSIGMGPILGRFVWHETEWRVSLLPIGGYVDIEGMAPTQLADGSVLPPSTGMAKLGWWGKTAVLAAGPISNILLAILIVAAVFAGQGKIETIENRAKLYQVLEGSQAQREGFRTNDVINQVDGKPIQAFSEVRQALLKNGHHRFGLQRIENNQSTTLEIAFDWAPNQTAGGERPKFGVSIGPDQNTIKVTLLEALRLSSQLLISGIPATVQAFLKGVRDTFTMAGSKEITGPIGTANAIGQAAEQGPWPLLTLAGLLNLSLGVFNFLPIPGLDGGRILLSSIQAIRRRPFAPGQEELINFLGFAFVLAFIGLVTFRDIARLGG